MPNPTTQYGRQDVAWPDLRSDPGSTLHGQITAAIAYLSNNITARWSGSLTLSASSTAQIIHNFDSALAGLKIFVVEAGSVLSKDQQDAAYTFAFVNNDTISVQNISGVSKTFQVYVYPSGLNIRGSDLDPAIDISTTGSVYLQNKVAGQQANNGQFGTLVTLTEPTTLHTVLTANTLSSVQGIAAPADSRGRVVIFTNATGGVVSFANDSGTAANRLLTGTGADLQLDNNASVLLKYDTSVSKWRVIGSTGGGSSAITVEQAHSFTVGQAIRLNGSTYVTAQANSAANAEVVGIVSKVVDADTFQYVASGEITGLSGLTAGEVYFLRDDLAGGISITEPTTVGNISIPVGIATSTTKLMVGIKRGIVVGGANLRTQIGLSNNATTTIQDVSAYHGGSLSGWIEIAATTPLKFYFEARFAKNGAGTDFLISPQYVGNTPPSGFAITVTTAGLIQVTLPSITGFSSASANFALNAPAVGTTLPLQISSGLITPDGSAFSVNGWNSGSVSVIMSSTSPTVQRIISPSSAISVTLPSAGIKAGYQMRLIASGCSETNHVKLFSSSGSEIERLTGVGFIEVTAIVDSPTSSSDWIIVNYRNAGILSFSDVTFSAIGGGSWSVDSGDFSQFSYIQTPGLLTLNYQCGPFTITGAVTDLVTTLPTRFKQFLSNQTNGITYNNTGSAFENGLVSTNAGSKAIAVTRNGGSLWTAGANLSYFRLSVVLSTN